MAKVETVRVVQTDLHEHPAVRAWREMKSSPVEPERIEILKGKSPKQTERFKRLVCRLVDVGPAGSAVIGKRCRRANAVIENTIYKEVLPYLPIPSLDYYGMVEEANGEFCWLFLEDAGEQAYSDLIDEHRALSTQLLSLMHTSATHLTAPSCLPDKGPNHYLKLLQFARHAILKNLASLTLHADEMAPLEAIVSLCDELESRWDKLKAFCEGAPQTLVHGDFVAKNLRLRSSQSGLILLPFDWGEGGWGIPAVDLMHVDVTSYWSIVHSQWPWLSVEVIRRLAIVGKIFRSLDAVCWELGDFKYKWLQKPISCMRIYASWLVDAIRAAGLN